MYQTRGKVSGVDERDTGFNDTLEQSNTALTVGILPPHATSGQAHRAVPKPVDHFRGVTIRGFWLEAPAVRTSPKLGEAIKTGARLIAEGKLHVLVAAVYPLAAAMAAILRAQTGGRHNRLSAQLLLL